MMLDMSTRETRVQRGRRRAARLLARTIGELRDARINLGVSQGALAAEVGCTASNIWRLEALEYREVALVRLSEIASVLGYELALTVHPIGDGMRDKGQQAIAERFRALLSDAWQLTTEQLLPMPGDRRSWDLFVRLVGVSEGGRVGVDIESRVHDVQMLVRRTRERERDGGADRILIVLSDSAANRRLAPQLREALGPSYATSPRVLLRQLREGKPLTGSGLLMI